MLAMTILEFILAGLFVSAIVMFVVTIGFGFRSQKSLLKAKKFIIEIEYDPVRDVYSGSGHAHNAWGRMFGTSLGLNQICNTSCCEEDVEHALRATEIKLRKLTGTYRKPVLFYVERDNLSTYVRP